MAVTPFDLPHSKTPCYMQTSVVLCFIEAELCPIEVYIAEIHIFDLYCSCDLDLDPMTFIIRAMGRFDLASALTIDCHTGLYFYDMVTPNSTVHTFIYKLDQYSMDVKI